VKEFITMAHYPIPDCEHEDKTLISDSYCSVCGDYDYDCDDCGERINHV
jgi:hypothetical protein